MNPLKVLFLGTPDFAAACLQGIIQSDSFKLQAVLTKPDIKQGRGMREHPSAVKTLALQNGIPVYTPSSFQNKADINFVKDLDIDVVIIVAYGIILPPYFLDWFHRRIVNIHTSLLPRWRGASPIQSSLRAGDLKTGITLQEVGEKMDAGSIISQKDFLVTSEMDTATISTQMIHLSIDMILQDLPKYLQGQIQPTIQDELKVTYCKKIQNEDLKINWQESAIYVFNQIRAYVINGGSYTFYKEKRLKLFKAELHPKGQGSPGQILEHTKSGLLVACGEGALWIKELQLMGKKRQKIEEFMRGARFTEGEFLI